MRLARVALYAVGVAAMFVMAAGIDRLVGPLFAPPMPSAHRTSSPHPATPMPMPTPGGVPVHGDHKLTPERGLPWIPGGLQIAEDGYALLLVDSPSGTGRKGRLAFRIIGPNGRPVTEYTPTHEKPLHLIVVRRDLTHYQHVHPVLAADGTWSTSLTFAKPGTYRLIADSLPRDRVDPLILGTDLLIPGYQEPTTRPPDLRTSEVGGYNVSMQGNPAAGAQSRLTFTVTRNGRTVDDLEPYLGSHGHLVALRSGDLAYLHVHPADTPGPTIAFDTEVPSAGTYRLYLDFRHAGRVRTAVFTLTVKP